MGKDQKTAAASRVHNLPSGGLPTTVGGQHRRGRSAFRTTRDEPQRHFDHLHTDRSIRTWYMKNLLLARAPTAVHRPGFSTLSTSSSSSTSVPPAAAAAPFPPPPPSRLPAAAFLGLAVSNARLRASSTPSTRAIVWPVAVLVRRPCMCQHAGGAEWVFFVGVCSSPPPLLPPPLRSDATVVLLLRLLPPLAVVVVVVVVSVAPPAPSPLPPPFNLCERDPNVKRN